MRHVGRLVVICVGFTLCGAGLVMLIASRAAGRLLNPSGAGGA